MPSYHNRDPRRSEDSAHPDVYTTTGLGSIYAGPPRNRYGDEPPATAHHAHDERHFDSRSNAPGSYGESQPIYPRHTQRRSRGDYRRSDVTPPPHHRRAPAPMVESARYLYSDYVDVSRDGGSYDASESAPRGRTTYRRPTKHDLQVIHEQFRNDAMTHADVTDGKGDHQETIEPSQLFELVGFGNGELQDERIIYRRVNELRATPQAEDDYHVVSVGFSKIDGRVDTAIKHHGAENPSRSLEDGGGVYDEGYAECEIVKSVVDRVIGKHPETPWKREMSLRELGKLRDLLEHSAKKIEGGIIPVGSIKLYGLVCSCAEELMDDKEEWRTTAWFKVAPSQQ